MTRLLNTAVIAWRKKADYPGAETFRGSPTTPAMAKLWAEKMNKECPDLMHWVESVVDYGEAKKVLAELGYTIEEGATEQQIDEALLLAQMTGELRP